MSTFVTATNRLALKCDREGCTATFHPRKEMRNAATLRVRAHDQGWHWRPENRDYCCHEHEVAANGEPRR